MAAKAFSQFAKLLCQTRQFAEGVIDAMTGPVTLGNRQTTVDDFTARMAAAQAVEWLTRRGRPRSPVCCASEIYCVVDLCSLLA